MVDRHISNIDFLNILKFFLFIIRILNTRFIVEF
jgi:hypothetical protein